MTTAHPINLHRHDAPHFHARHVSGCGQHPSKNQSARTAQEREKNVIAHVYSRTTTLSFCHVSPSLSPRPLYILLSPLRFKFQVPTSLLSPEADSKLPVKHTAHSNQTTPFRMSSSDLQLPPGFRFHPTDEELVKHYLCRKCQSQPISVPIIAEIDLYKYNPWDLPGNFSPSKIRF